MSQRCQQQTYRSQHNSNVVTLQVPNRLTLQAGIGRSAARWYVPCSLKEGTRAEAKLAPNLPDWMVEHANRYLASGGTDGHLYKVTVPQRGEITAPALLLTTIGRSQATSSYSRCFTERTAAVTS
jgi:hypothetical protein